MADRRAQQETTREERADESGVRDSRTCPECAGRLVADSEAAETVCEECGLVVEEESIDRGPEWRAFDAEERWNKSRVGAPTTNMRHDKGLSTSIGWQNEGSRGKELSPRKRRRMQRLRTWDERSKTRDAKERNLKQALGEIDRMASALGVPDPTRETASVIYRRALDAGLLPGRSIEGVATAALYAASRLENIPRSFDEIGTVSRVDDIEIKRTYRYLSRELGLEIPPANPNEYLGRLASELACTAETEHRARELVRTALSQGIHSGKDPVGIAASALYAAGQLTDEQLTQSAISDVANTSEVTIRNRYREILAAAGETDQA